jgi:DnaJ-class molecular chaperone
MEGYVYKGTRGCSSCGGRGRVIISAVTSYEFTETCGYCRGHGYVSLYEINLKATSSDEPGGMTQ